MDKKFKILKIDHIAVAVKNLKESSTLFQLLGMDCEDIESVKSENVDVVKIHIVNKNSNLSMKNKRVKHRGICCNRRR